MKWFLLFVIFSASAFSTIVLNEVMPTDVQKKTGISSLTTTQRQELEKWLNDNVELKTASKTQKDLYLSENLEAGKKIRLSDGSLYAISPDDWSRASLWITPFPIKIENSGNLNYPLKLTNTNTGSSVKAKLIQG